MNPILEQLSAIHTDTIKFRLPNGEIVDLPRFIVEPELMPKPKIRRVRLWFSVDGFAYPIRYARFVVEERIKIAKLNKPAE